MPEIKPQAGATDVKMYGFVDFVVCLDTTGSMNSIIENVKQHITDSLIKEMNSKMAKNQSKLEWRGRILGFGDVEYHDEPFYEGTFTNDEQQLTRELQHIPRTGYSVDVPESSLDALYLAARSPWRKDVPVHKVVILFTDAAPKEIHAKTCQDGPRDAQKIIDEYTKRKIKLFLYGPRHEFFERLETISRATINLWSATEVYDQLDKMDFSKEFEIMAATISTESAELNKGAALPTKSF